MFGSDELIIEGVLVPLRAGTAVHYRPPAWERGGRVGAIDVASGRRLVIIEGVGIGRRELAHLIDALLWVQSDLVDAERREAARVEADEVPAGFAERWSREEIPFLVEQRPWARAALIAAGSPPITYDPGIEMVIASRRVLQARNA